ncbi:fibronectin type III domain-containing protein [Catelliglobosispora koreensis]|uniref:fibronectin type III domain-containing protein n=1 Tax=Catelliglobosispora koreensis TaxID=129052 RepID=UPI0009FC9A2B|nr:fibronectin type III domain-containing protein [Catelliglobosispora koreensis]
MPLSVKVVAAATLLVLVSASQAVAKPPVPPRDTQPPTIPGNLRTTNVTQTSVSLAWNTSTDNRQVVFYGVWAPGLSVIYVNHPGTTATYNNLHPGTTYAFRVQAWDGMNWSLPSNILNVTTQPDVVAPGAPANLALTDSLHGFPVDGVTASKVLITWVNSTDDFGPLRYEVLVNGVVNPNVDDTRPQGLPITSPHKVWVRQLDPATTYTIAVRAIDGGGNISALSNTVTVTTDASSDTAGPTTPVITRLHDGGTGACPEEIWLWWTPSTDSNTPQNSIEYEVRVNGVINEVFTGGFNAIAYTEVPGVNVVTLVAVDPAGNASAPSNSFTIVNSWTTSCV